MSAVTLIARETFPYAGLIVRRGERFIASHEDARVLGIIGRADRAPEGEPEPDTAVVTAPVRRRYQRKDLIAEG